MDHYTRPFSDIRLTDIPIVGGKNASLGEMFSQLSAKGILLEPANLLARSFERTLLLSTNPTNASSAAATAAAKEERPAKESCTTR